MTKEEWQVFNELRDKLEQEGYAFIVWSPEELKGVDNVQKVIDACTSEGWEAIERNGGEPQEEERDGVECPECGDTDVHKNSSDMISCNNCGYDEDGGYDEGEMEEEADNA